MNAKLKRSRIVTTLLVLAAAAGQAGAADPRHGGTEAVLTVSLSRDAASSSRPSPSRASLPDRLAAYDNDALAFADQALDGQIPPGRYAVQLYPIEQGGRVADVASVIRSAAPAQSGTGLPQREGLPAARKALLPEPGNWAMIFAGLLGVCAIARRRMSA